MSRPHESPTEPILKAMTTPPGGETPTWAFLVDQMNRGFRDVKSQIDALTTELRAVVKDMGDGRVKFALIEQAQAQHKVEIDALKRALDEESLAREELEQKLQQEREEVLKEVAKTAFRVALSIAAAGSFVAGVIAYFVGK